jgi:hypothetical protein
MTACSKKYASIDISPRYWVLPGFNHSQRDRDGNEPARSGYASATHEHTTDILYYT